MAFHHALRPFDEIRPLRLVEHQPSDALERARRINLQFKPVNLSGSPVPGVGGLTFVILVLMATITMPAIWWLTLGSMLAGSALGLIWIAISSSRT
jgi:hypothetical protein